jgi:hypothetical protein
MKKTLRAFVMAGLFTNHNINFSDTTIQPYISNYCLFLANQTQNFTKNVTITNDTLKPFYENNTTPKSILFLKQGE